jgi:hypothetical protein
MTGRRDERDEDRQMIDPGRDLVAEKIQDREAWELRRQGTLIGIVWREDRKTFRAAFERSETMTQIPRTFPSIEEAARALDRTVR